MWSACSSMIRKNCNISAGSRAGEAPSTVAAEPLMEVSGARSSWLTMPRNSARNRSSSSSGAKSCRVTTTDSTSSSAERIGVALTSVFTLRPSGTESTISSARTVSPLFNCRVRGNWSREISRPSARRQVTTSSICSGERPGMCRSATIRFASRFSDVGLPVRASKTTTPTGEVSTRTSRSARARRSSRCVRALAIAVAACDANSTRTSSSSLVNSRPPSLPPRKKWPTSTPRCRIGVPWKVVDGITSQDKPSDRT